MAGAMLAFRGVRKSFRMRNRSDSLRDALPRLAARLAGRKGKPSPRFTALDDVSWEVGPGQVLGIVGANGAGKSTSLRLAAGIYEPDEGEVFVGGRVSALIELSAGFHPDLSGRENVYLAGALLGLRHREVEDVFDRIVDFAGIGDFLESPVRTYSSGMAVRLGFAVAAHVPAEILLVDEVLAVGDLEFRSRCLKRMAERRAEGAAVLFVSHNLGIIEQFCDRVLFIHRGKVLADGPPRETLAAYRRHVSAGARTGDVREAATPQLRRGTGDLSLEDVVVAGGGHGEPGALGRGGDLAVEGRWQCRRPVPAAFLTVEIHSAEGALLVRRSRPLGEEGRPVPEAGSFRLVIPALPLLPGLYEVTVAAAEPSGVVFLDRHQRLYSFRVMGDLGSDEDGLLSVDAHWGPGGPG